MRWCTYLQFHCLLLLLGHLQQCRYVVCLPRSCLSSTQRTHISCIWAFGPEWTVTDGRSHFFGGHGNTRDRFFFTLTIVALIAPTLTPPGVCLLPPLRQGHCVPPSTDLLVYLTGIQPTGSRLSVHPGLLSSHIPPMSTS